MQIACNNEFVISLNDFGLLVFTTPNVSDSGARFSAKRFVKYEHLWGELWATSSL